MSEDKNNSEAKITLESISSICEGNKRQSIPYIVKWICPKCGKDNEANHTNGWYLSFPDLNGLYDTDYSCQHEFEDENGNWHSCLHTVQVRFKLTLLVEVVNSNVLKNNL